MAKTSFVALYLDSLRVPLTEVEVEDAYFRAKGLMLDVGTSPRITPHDVVRLVVQKFEYPADRCWDMTIGDLLLMMQDRGPSSLTTDSPMQQRVMCLDFDRRQQLRDSLTLNERIELE